MRKKEELFELMFKEEVSLIFDNNFKIKDFNENVKLPFGMKNDPNNLKEWVAKRMDISSRPNYDKLLETYGLRSPNIWDLIAVSYCVSFRDCYWIRSSKDSGTSWGEVNPYETYGDEMLATMLGDDNNMVMYLGKSCGEFTYRGRTTKGYHRDSKTKQLYVYKIYKDTRLVYRELLVSRLFKILNLGGMVYEQTSIRFANGEEKLCLATAPNTSEEKGFITLEELLESSFMDYRLNTNIEVYNSLPDYFKDVYIKLRIMMYILDADADLEDRICFYVNNKTQEVVGYFGVYGTSRCLLYELELSEYTTCRDNDGISTTQQEKLEDIRELLQLIDSEDNSELVGSLIKIKECINDRNCECTLSHLIETDELEGILQFINIGIDSILGILRNLSQDTKGKIITVNNHQVISFSSEGTEEVTEERYDDGYLKMTEDSNFK